MEKYIIFNFNDGECEHYPIIVKIKKELSIKEFEEIEKYTQDQINSFIKSDEYWDSDDHLVEVILTTLSNQMNFDFEIVPISYTISC